MVLFRRIGRNDTACIGADRVSINGIALGRVGQDTEGVAGVQDDTGLGCPQTHLVNVGFQNDLHVGHLIGEIAPVGFQMDYCPKLYGAEV